jgi:DNA-binding FadR family transcriptional regulator
MMRPVRRGNAFEETMERLLTVIKLGLVGPGERFPSERDLAAQLGVSRLTLREAIHELHQAGYVCSRRGRFGGTFVTYTRPAPDSAELSRLAREDRDELTDALTFRLAVETGAAEALALRFARATRGRARPAGRGAADPAAASGPAAQAGDALTAAAEGRRAAADADSPARTALLSRLARANGASPQDYRRMDTLFHLSIAELTGSSMLASAAADARLRLNDLLNAIPLLPPNIEHSARQHAAIVEAILAGDTERARSKVAEHLEGTAALLRGFLG